MASFKPGYGKVDRDYGMRLATTPPDEDGPVWMVNLMKYKEVASYTDGNPSGISGKEADDRYAPTKILHEIGAEVPFFGDVELQLMGDDVKWDRIGVVKYPTRRSFIDMQSRQDFKGKHEHKEAGMEFTFVIGCQPIDLSSVPPPRDWSEVEHPPTDEDGPVVVLHVIRFADDARATKMADYERAAYPVASQHGGGALAWFNVEGTIMGDGRNWDQVRFNLFPSLRAFMAVASNPERIESQTANRDVAIADTYAMVVRPGINRF
jgi:hypothetical protein